MSEHDANRAMLDTARLRIMAEPVEDAQLMTFSERMYRAREAIRQHVDRLYGRDGDMARIIAARIDRLPDFREGRREYRLLPHEIAQQDGFPDNE